MPRARGELKFCVVCAGFPLVGRTATRAVARVVVRAPPVPRMCPHMYSRIVGTCAAYIRFIWAFGTSRLRQHCWAFSCQGPCNKPADLGTLVRIVRACTEIVQLKIAMLQYEEPRLQVRFPT